MIFTFNAGDVFSLKFKGNRTQARQMVENLVTDFNEPKFGYNGENFDEHHD